MNLRNQGIDKRRLKAEDRSFDDSDRQRAKARAQQRRGFIAYQQNRPIRTTLSKSAGKAAGFGDFSRYGSEAQMLRMMEKSQLKKRAEGFRPQNMKGPEDPM